MTSLALCFNRLASLLDGIFDTLTKLQSLQLQGNDLRDSLWSP